MYAPPMALASCQTWSLSHLHELRRQLAKVSDVYRIKGAFRVFHGAVAKPVQCNPQSNLSKMKIHTVHKGESLATIAKQHGTTINAIAKENNLSNINNLKIGQKLLIPCGQ